MKTRTENKQVMRKVRSDSVLGGLSGPKQAILRQWLLEENLSYREVRRRVETEFGVKTTENSLTLYYRRLALERRTENMADVMRSAKDLATMNQSVEFLEQGIMDFASLAAYEMSLEPAERMRVEDISMLMKVVTQARRQRLEEKRYELAKKKMETHGIIALGRFNQEMKSMPTPESTRRAVRMANEMLEGKMPTFGDEDEDENPEADVKTAVAQQTEIRMANQPEKSKPVAEAPIPPKTEGAKLNRAAKAKAKEKPVAEELVSPKKDKIKENRPEQTKADAKSEAKPGREGSEGVREEIPAEEPPLTEAEWRNSGANNS